MVKKFISVLLSTVMVVGILSLYGTISFASTGGDEVVTINQRGTYYTFDENSHYTFSSSTGLSTNSSNTYGNFALTGDIEETDSIDGFTSYNVNSGVVEIYYTYDDDLLTAPEHSWHLINDNSKTVNGISLSKKIKKGVIILETSLDGENWVQVPEYIACNVFAETPTQEEAFATSFDIQQINGTYFRFIVAYEVERKVSSDEWYDWVPGVSEYEKEKRCEVYEFYLIDSNADDYISSGLSMELGEVVNTGKDNGYSGSDPIDSNDPHYGWTLGGFTISGYTQKQPNTSENVFLKNEGDRVVLSFHLDQDIDCLNGDDSRIIYSDTNGYDRYFQTSRDIDFGRGTLIIRHTNSSGVRSQAQIYTNFLSAFSSTGADTRVQLFEEGDYEVALDYEICDTTGVNTYTNYRIYFEFSIRNGNCMAFPMDTLTESELDNYSITPNGFYIDWARSRYLTISVERRILNSSGTGLDTRYNRPSSDGSSYTSEGIYYINITNNYTGDTSQIIICVGSNQNLITYFNRHVVG